MLSQANFSSPAEYKKHSNATELNYLSAIGALLLVFLAMVHLSGDVTEPQTAATLASSVSSENEEPNLKRSWPKETLAQRIKQLGLEGRVSLNGANQAPTLTIRVDLLFSEGARDISRAGSHALQKVFEGLEPPTRFTILLAQRSNTEVEYTHGVQMELLNSQRKHSLNELLRTLGLEATIQP